jgi:hypothetical protein
MPRIETALSHLNLCFGYASVKIVAKNMCGYFKKNAAPALYVAFRCGKAGLDVPFLRISGA